MKTIRIPFKRQPNWGESTNWFDRLAEHARDNKYIGLEFLTSNVKLYPNKNNLQSVRNMAETLKDKKLRRDVLATINAVDAGAFSREGNGEFKYKFHSYSRQSSQCSACGSLFSLLRQALEYHA